jgi:ABC-type transport system substrate-binding protein
MVKGGRDPRRDRALSGRWPHARAAGQLPDAVHGPRTTRISKGNVPNSTTQYKNSEVDALLRRRAAKRPVHAGAQAEQKILDDAPIIPIFWPVSHTLVKPCVQGYPNVSMTVPKYRYVDIVKP